MNQNCCKRYCLGNRDDSLGPMVDLASTRGTKKLTCKLVVNIYFIGGLMMSKKM